MNQSNNPLVDKLNHENMDARLKALKELIRLSESGVIASPRRGSDVNNHIHTNYSFSPYSPSKAIWMAYMSGLATAGIMDHDSVGGAEEFRKAGKIAGVATTTGIECRADMSATPLCGRRINNPDQLSVAYIALHGIPSTQIDTVREFFLPYTKERNKRNRAMVEKINDYFKPFDISLDFEKDVVPLSKAHAGGSITERHILYALAIKLTEVYGKGEALTDFLENKLSIKINQKTRTFLTDPANPHYVYDLLGLLKSELIGIIYIDATLECPKVEKVLDIAKKTGSICAYAYLGDVSGSVTGDKKDQKFEDDYIELLFDYLKAAGFNAVTYMPSRNTRTQLEKVRSLCDKHGLFQISGEDINSSRQSFVCEAMKDDYFKNLKDSAWALIGHEKLASGDLTKGMFSPEEVQLNPVLADRIKKFMYLGYK